MIRAAIPADAARICELGERFFNEAGWPEVNLTWDESSVRDTLAILAAHGVLLVAEVDGVVVGMAGAGICPAYFNRNQTVAQELFWYVEEEHRNGVGAALLRALEAGVKTRGAHTFTMITVAGMRSDALARLYRRDGYRPAELSFIKRVA
jgi:GNAT superfamily N-acetyltransferase